MNADGAPARRGVDAAAIALVLLIPTLLFADVLFGGKRLYDRDITAYHYPMKSMVRRAMLSGEFPYWNPLFAGGQPLAANPAYELFYPPQWLILLPDYDLGFRLSIVIHFYIAALGMYLLLRSIALTPLSASFGSITFTLSGLLSSLTNLLPYLSSVAWMPLIVLFVLRFLRTKSSRDFALAALFLSMQVLCGEPMTLFQTEVLVLVIGLSQAREARAGAAATLRSVVSCLAIILAASLTGAAQLLPMIDHAGDSVRSLGFSFDSATGWSTPLIRVFEFVFPHWMGSVADGGAHYWGASYYQPATSAFIASFYVGLLAFALAVGGIICRSRGWSLTVGVFGGSLLLAAGRNTPVYRLLFHLPFFSATRYPEKYLIAGVFVLIVFASTVLDRLVTGDAAMARTLRIVTLALAAISALALMVSFLPKYEPWFKLLWQIPESARITSFLLRSRLDWSMALLRAVALAGVIALLNRRRDALAGLAVVAFILIDLGPVAFEVAPRISSTFFTPPPAVSLLPDDRASYRLFNQAALDSVSENAQRFLNGEQGYWTLRNGLFPTTPGLWGFRTILEKDFDKTELLPTLRLREALNGVLDRGDGRALTALMMMSNVRYRLLYADYSSVMRQAGGRIENALPVRALAVPLVPRYYFADEIAGAANNGEVVNRLMEKAWSHRVAFLETKSYVPAAGMVTRLVETAQKVDLDVSCQGSALLVIGITRHKYWRARVDGRAAQLIPANIAFQALSVPQGNHHIELRYRNPLVVIGMWISALALLGLIAISWRSSNPS